MKTNFISALLANININKYNIIILAIYRSVRSYSSLPTHFRRLTFSTGFKRISRGLWLSLLNGHPEIYGENSKQAEKVASNRSEGSAVQMSERQRNYPDINHLLAAGGGCPAALAAAT